MGLQRSVDAPRHTGESRLVKNKVRAGNRPLNRSPIGNVPFSELNLVPAPGQILLPPGHQIIQHPHAVSTSDQRLDKMRADKAGTAGDERKRQGGIPNDE